MNVKRFLCLFNIIFINSCSTLFPQNSKKSGDINEQRKSASFLDSLFQDDPIADQNSSQNNDNMRSSLSQ